MLEVSFDSNFQSCLRYVFQGMNGFIPCIRLDVCRNVVRAAIIQPSKKPPLEQSSCCKGSSCFHLFEEASRPSKLEAAGTLLISSQMKKSGDSKVDCVVICKLCDVCYCRRLEEDNHMLQFSNNLSTLPPPSASSGCQIPHRTVQ